MFFDAFCSLTNGIKKRRCLQTAVCRQSSALRAEVEQGQPEDHIRKLKRIARVI
jgi:hypothetical protein